MSISYGQGFAKVRNEDNYVFIGEELSALHEINKRPCDIAISGIRVYTTVFTIFKEPSYNIYYANWLHRLQHIYIEKRNWKFVMMKSFKARASFQM